MLPIKRPQPSMNRNRCIRLPRSCVIFIAFLAAGGCASYGGKYQKITLVTDPPDAIAYAMTYEVWRKNGGRIVLSNDDLLDTYRIKSGLTPVTHELLPYEHVFIAEWEGQRDFMRFTPKAGQVYNLKHPTTHGAR